jgi:hypothetical protein
MKKYKLAIGAAALAVFVTQQAAQATLTTATSGSGTFVSSSLPVTTIPVSYDVVYNSTTLLYTYLYAFTPIAGSPIGQFTVNANYVSSVLTFGTPITGSPYTITGSITSTGTIDAVNGLVSWAYNPYTSAAQFVGFTSLYAPTAGSGSLNDHLTGPWGDNGIGTPIPVPVPEASTIAAGALMLLPFGIGAVRSLRRERTA